MRLGRVIGRVWSTVKSEQFDGRKLLLIQPIDAAGGDTDVAQSKFYGHRPDGQHPRPVDHKAH